MLYRRLRPRRRHVPQLRPSLQNLPRLLLRHPLRQNLFRLLRPFLRVLWPYHLRQHPPLGLRLWLRQWRSLRPLHLRPRRRFQRRRVQRRRHLRLLR